MDFLEELVTAEKCPIVLLMIIQLKNIRMT